jgi:hypothetical protein
MIEKLKEILGALSGYKQKYDDLHSELQTSEETIEEADSIASEILAILKNWDVNR